MQDATVVVYPEDERRSHHLCPFHYKAFMDYYESMAEEKRPPIKQL